MFVYFNKEGVIKEIINDSSIRQGNANVNTVYFFIEGADPQTTTDSNGMYYKALYFSLGRYTMYLLDEHGEPLPSIEGVSFDISTVKMEVPYDKKKELKFFKYFTRYEMFQLPIPQEVLNYKGTVGLKFQMVNNDAINTQGLIVFNIEGTSPDLEIAPDTAITIAEWNYLLANMLTPEDVYTKAEANSTFQEKLIAGENITIEDNVISATGGGSGGRAEWGSITGNIEDQTDLQTELSGKQDTLTFDNTPTSDSSNPVTSDGIYDALQDVREVAEGKCQTFVLSYVDSLVVVKNEIQSNPNVKVFNGSGADITQAVLNGDYDNQTFGNANFNSQANQISCLQSPYSTYLIVRVNGGYMFLQYSDVINRKKGDIYLVVQIDVPDRWYGNDYTFYKLETSKVDLTNYVTLDGTQTITGQKTFNNSIVLSNGTANLTITNNGWTSTIEQQSGAGITFGGTEIAPITDGTKDLGSSLNKWKDLYLSGKVDFGNDAYITKDQYNRITLNVSDNAKIVVDAGQTYVNNNLLPLTATRDLGSNDYQWKDLYLSGRVNIGGENYSGYISNESNRITFYYGGGIRFQVGNSDATFTVSYIRANADNNSDIGQSNRRWRHLYLSGNISDGTKSISVANIANKNNFVTLTQAQYDALATKDPDTFYFIEE